MCSRVNRESGEEKGKKMAEIWTMGEMLVEIMRPTEGCELFEKGEFLGPYPSGAPAICIDTAAKLGHETAMIGGVGADDFGKCLLDRLEADGVDCSHVLVSGACATGVAFVTYFEDGSRKFIFHMGNTPAVKAKAPEREDIRGAGFFHIMGCSLTADRIFAEEILKTMGLFREEGARISFDPNVRRELFTDESRPIMQEVLRNCSVYLPGEEELLFLSGRQNTEEAVEACFENPLLELLVLKKGGRGAVIYTREGQIPIGVYRVDAVDPTGAGDSFDGAFLCGLLEGKSPAEAGRMAAAAAAINTAAFGPMEGRTTKEKVQEMMRGTQAQTENGGAGR